VIDAKRHLLGAGCAQLKRRGAASASKSDTMRAVTRPKKEAQQSAPMGAGEACLSLDYVCLPDAGRLRSADWQLLTR
jgi:hypothetical protein